ncbi:unnamed protein product [Schistosoma curassoni]|uniref:Uncharacterized protein n=1 Tax=Schistosoma curassoni TaxID=6186 RepID=A0A183KS14_9TREM|nr:unnamed protein product [Schistosoma curassoni]
MSNWFLYSAKQRHLSLSDAEDGVHEIKRINTKFSPPRAGNDFPGALVVVEETKLKKFETRRPNPDNKPCERRLPSFVLVSKRVTTLS